MGKPIFETQDGSFRVEADGSLFDFTMVVGGHFNVHDHHIGLPRDEAGRLGICLLAEVDLKLPPPPKGAIKKLVEAARDPLSIVLGRLDMIQTRVAAGEYVLTDDEDLQAAVEAARGIEKVFRASMEEKKEPTAPGERRCQKCGQPAPQALLCAACLTALPGAPNVEKL